MDSTSEPGSQDLGRSFQELLRKDHWELDAEPDPLQAGEEPGHSQSLPNSTSATPAASASTSAQPPSLLRILEAMLFLGGVPLTLDRAAEVIRGLSPDQFQQAIDELGRTYRSQGRPYAMLKQEGGHVLALRPTFRYIQQRLAGGMREARLSTAAIEVLAVIAYRQPATKQEVDTLRGHESAAILRQLVRRGLINVTSRAESGGRDVQYGTTSRFLELFSLKSLDDLPRTEDLQRL
jgi:segregation and condensation protein B